MTKNDAGGFSAEERAAMKQRAAELRADAKRAKGEAKAAAEEAEQLAKIASMPDGDREMRPDGQRTVLDVRRELEGSTR